MDKIFKFFKLKRTPPSICLLWGNLIFLVIIILRATGILQSLELTTYDQYLRLLPTTLPDSRIVLIGETEDDIQRLGYPLPDGVLAEALERLNRAQPRVIGVDKYRDIPVPPGTEKLNEILTRYSNIIWVMKFGVAGTVHSPILPPTVLQSTDQIGFSDIPLDRDGIVRRGLLILDDGKQFAYSLPLVVTLYYLRDESILLQSGTRHPEHLQLGKTTIPPFEANDGGYINADTAGYQFLLDFQGMPVRFQTYSLSELLDGRIPSSSLQGRIVLIGAMTESLEDRFYTPFNNGNNERQNKLFSVYHGADWIYGVELHALVISQLLRFALDGVSPIQSLSELQETLWIWCWCMAGSLLGLQRLALMRFFSRTLLTWFILAGACYLALWYRWWLPLVPPLLGMVLATTTTTAYLSVHEYAEKKLLMQLFSRHVSPTIAQTIWEARAQFLEAGRLRSQRLTATVLFTDIAGFTSISEALDPVGLMEWLNAYMEAMAQVVMTHGGIVNKYIGDAIMAVFGVPIPHRTETEIAQDVMQAVRCALAMSEELKRLNQQWQVQGLPSIAMRVGIYTGPLVAGNLGSKERLEYTVIGDTVNVASRLESFRKEDADSEALRSNCRILIGESTWRHLDDRFQTQPVGMAKLKGKKEEIAVYRVLGYS